jgi:hypothetical protein
MRHKIALLATTVVLSAGIILAAAAEVGAKMGAIHAR